MRFEVSFALLFIVHKTCRRGVIIFPDIHELVTMDQISIDHNDNLDSLRKRKEEVLHSKTSGGEGSSQIGAKQGLAEPIELKRQIGLLSAISITIGIIIGSGIFISPKGILQNSGSVGVSLIIWASCGVISLIGALCYAELGTTFNRSGGSYTYLKEIFGPFLAFLFLWENLLIVIPGDSAIIALTFAQYVILPFVPTGCFDAPNVVVKLVAVLCIGTLTFINSISVKGATRVQNVFTLAKLVGLGIIIISGIVLLFKGNTKNLQNAFDPYNDTVNISFQQISLAFYSGFFAYTGWVNLLSVVEELKQPKRNIPLALILSLTSVTVLYLLANVSYLTAMSPEEILASDAVALTFGDRVLGTRWSWVMAVTVAISTFGSLNGIVMGCSRLGFVAGRTGHLPTILSMIHITRLTPLPALLFMMLLTFTMLIPNDVYTLINYVGFASWLFKVITVSGLLYYRWKRPDLERPFMVPIILPIFFIITTGAILVLSIFAAPLETLVGAAIILIGAPVFFICVKWQSKHKKFNQFWTSFTKFWQKILMVVPQETDVGEH